MSGILQLDPALWVETPLGLGLAVIYENDGNDFYWTVMLNKSKAIVQFRNEKIRAATSYTLGRGMTDARMRKIISRAT